MTLLNKITPQGDTLKPSIKGRISEIKEYYGIDDMSEASDTMSIDLMSMNSQGKKPTLYSVTKIKSYLQKKAK